jgi:hypothetical protein
MKNVLSTVLLVSLHAVCLPVFAQIHTVDLQMDGKDCKLDVSVTLSDRKRNVSGSRPKTGAVAAATIRFPEHFVMRLNGKLVEPPADFLHWYVDASRMTPIDDSQRCAFKIQRGDASTSSSVEVILGNGRIRSVTAVDLNGRTLSTTTYRYPGVVVIE